MRLALNRSDGLKRIKAGLKRPAFHLGMLGNQTFASSSARSAWGFGVMLLRQKTTAKVAAVRNRTTANATKVMMSGESSGWPRSGRRRSRWRCVGSMWASILLV